MHFSDAALAADFLWDNRAYLQRLGFALLCLGAWLRGSAPERILATSLFAVCLIDDLWHMAMGAAQFHKVEVWHLLLDAGIFAVAFAVALRANRIYPMVIAAAQYVALSSHALRWSDSEMPAALYSAIDIAPSYVELLAMALGLAFASARRSRGRTIDDWVASPRRLRRGR